MSGRWTVGYLSDNFDQCKHFLAVFNIMMNVGVYFIYIYIYNFRMSSFEIQNCNDIDSGQLRGLWLNLFTKPQDKLQMNIFGLRL